MILNRFFKPKWQHPKPQTRKLALQSLNADDPVLAQIAREDQDPGVRRAALNRITDLSLLQQLAADDPDAGVRELANARFWDLMAGGQAESLPVETRLEYLTLSPRSEGVDFLAVNAYEPELRRAALERVDQQFLLGERAIADPAAELRYVALEHIHDPAVLEYVFKQSRNRDKRIHREARRRLDELKDERERLAAAENVCAELEALAAEMPNAADLQRLERAWQAQVSVADDALQKRYQRAHERALQGLQENEARRREKLKLCDALEHLLEQLLAEAEMSPESATTIQETLDNVSAEWARSATSDEADERRFDQLRQTIADRQRVLQRDHQRAESLREALTQADALHGQGQELQDADITRLRQRWQGLLRPESKSLVAELQTQFDTALDKLQARLQQQQQEKEQAIQELQDSVNELETALAQGELRQAIAHHDRVRHLLQRNLPPHRTAPLQERLRACAPKLAELRDWRRWGTSQARENLCLEAESLIGSEEAPQKIARQIQAARAAWKALDKAEGAAPKELWERFNQSCERAYAPCQTYFDAQAKQRQTNLEQKLALCAKLEEFEAGTDWEQPDWHKVDRFVRNADKKMRQIGPVSRTDRKSLNHRYQAISKRLGEHLRQERERELERRRALIKRVQELAELDDTRSAINAAKQAQAEWRPTVQGPRREEQALWREFRAACDDVFARRQAENQAAEETRQANLARKTALCDEVEALAGVEADALGQARGRLREIQREWSEVGAVPKAVQQDVERRFHAACENFERHAREQREVLVRKELAGLLDRARLCAQVEALLLIEDTAANEPNLAQAKAQWHSLPELQSASLEAIQSRFDAACLAVAEGGATRQSLLQTLEQNLAKKQLLCLRMEIATGTETPPEFAQARMEYQVSRLSESLVEREVTSATKNAGDEARKIQREWHVTGSLPGEQSDRLESRFLQILKTLDADTTG